MAGGLPAAAAVVGIAAAVASASGVLVTAAVGVGTAVGGSSCSVGWWQVTHTSILKSAWLSGKGRTLPGPWQIRQSVLPPTGCGIGLGTPVDGTFGGVVNWRTFGASSPTYFHWVAWQALLLQKLLLSVPPGLFPLPRRQAYQRR